jgi:hypothetical protein
VFAFEKLSSRRDGSPTGSRLEAVPFAAAQIESVRASGAIGDRGAVVVVVVVDVDGDGDWRLTLRRPR